MLLALFNASKDKYVPILFDEAGALSPPMTF